MTQINNIRSRINNLRNNGVEPDISGSDRLQNDRDNIREIGLRSWNPTQILETNTPINTVSALIKKALRAQIFVRRRLGTGVNREIIQYTEKQEYIKDSIEEINKKGLTKSESDYSLPLSISKDSIRDLSNRGKKVTSNRVKELSRITIVNLESQEFLGDKALKTIEIPTWPREIQYRAESQFVALTSIGRNNPHYNYVGAEDSLEFNIDWYTTDNNRAQVIENCRYLESLSKANGYENRPPLLKIQWGEDDILFKHHKWILVSAPYTMREFYGKYQTNKTQGADIQTLTGSNLPHQALQTVTFKRVTTHNLTTSDIRLV
jgi:hypothetical protein